MRDYGKDMSAVVLTIGVFDGVHRGHREVINRARVVATTVGARLVAVTFHPHPAQVLAPGRAPSLLTTISRRIELLKAAGADDVVVIEFDEALSKQSPEDFVDDVLMPIGNIKAIVVGENFRFGHRAVGDVTTLEDLGRSRGFIAEGLSLIGDPEMVWSSTRVRSLLLAGQVEAANEILARPHCVEGKVGHGDKRGRELGYPTANLMVPAGAAIPSDGVYAGRLIVNPHTAPVIYDAAISVGTNPQFAGTERRVEAYAIDQTGLDLYGKSVSLEFVGRLRGQMTFETVEGLITQMARDVVKAKELLA